jgi:putative flippase GtrA
MSELDLSLPPEGRSGRADGAAQGPSAALSSALPNAWRAFLPRLARETWNYFLVSLAALAVDYGLLMGLTSLAHVHYLVSAGVGFCAGLALNYALSVTLVFRESRLADRRVEFIVFMLIGLVGLALNEALMRFFVETAGLGYAVAKIPATGVGFVFNFGARRVMLFTRFAGVRG